MSKKEKTRGLRTWIEIDTKAVAHNYRVFRKLIGKKTKLMGVVKSNAYGHSLVQFSRELEQLGVDYLGVDSIVEALRLREEKIASPILVLGYTLPEMMGEAALHDIAITISSFSQLSEAMHLKTKKPLRVHIKVDTGMHRQGFQLGDSTRLLSQLGHRMSKLRVEGLYTHFAEAKNPRSGDNTRRQIKEFHEWIRAFHHAGFDPMLHAAASGGAMLYPDAHFDMVRIGIGLYGLWPSQEAERYLGKKITLKPVLSWKAVVSEVKEVKKGERVGYDFTEILRRESKIAIIPIGYWHGFPRLLSSKGRVLLHAKTARVLGRVSMDMIIVDVTEISNVREGDIATLIGKDGKEVITQGELANFSGTTHYEITTRLNPLMKKFYK